MFQKLERKGIIIMFRKLTVILLVCLILPGCNMFSTTTQTPPPTRNTEEIALEYLMNILGFSEPENRNFDISYPIVVEGENCYKIIITGKFNDGTIFNIGTFAVNVNHYFDDTSGSIIAYWFNDEANQFELLIDGTEPFLRYSRPTPYTSPDGNYRLELVDRDNGLRIVDLATGEFEWVADEYFYGGLIRAWSEDSRFALIELQSTFFVDFVIVDTNDFSSVRLSIKESFDLFSGYFPYEHAQFENYLGFDKWIDGSILQLSFNTETSGQGPFHGTFQYNAVNNRVSNFEYREGWSYEN